MFGRANHTGEAQRGANMVSREDGGAALLRAMIKH